MIFIMNEKYLIIDNRTIEIFKQKSVATNTTTELLSQPLVLQESDVLKAQANAANQVHIIVSFMEVTKGQL